MTEINLFPKQPQSVTVLVFITVLIVLFLILTVMVHMRNRKLKSTLEEQMAERRLYITGNATDTATLKTAAW